MRSRKKCPCSREAFNVSRVIRLPANAPYSGGSGEKVDDAPFAGLLADLDVALLRQPVAGRVVVPGGCVVQVDDDCTALGIVDEKELIGGNMRQRRGIPSAASAGAHRDEHPCQGADPGRDARIRASSPGCSFDPHEIPVKRSQSPRWTRHSVRIPSADRGPLLPLFLREKVEQEVRLCR